MVARYWLEEVAGIPCNVEIASEYRYRTSVANPKTLVVTISQSGENGRHARGAQPRQSDWSCIYVGNLQRAGERHHPSVEIASADPRRS